MIPPRTLVNGVDPMPPGRSNGVSAGVRPSALGSNWADSRTTAEPATNGTEVSRDAFGPIVTVVHLSVRGEPAPQGSKRYIGLKGGRGIIVDASKRTAPWRSNIAHEARLAMDEREPLSGPIQCDVTLYVTRPGGHYGKRGLLPSAPLYPTTRPDRDKLARAVFDALSGIVWRDDAQVVTGSTSKLYADGRGPGVEIRIERIAA